VPPPPMPPQPPSAPGGEPYVPEYLPYSSGMILPYDSARPRARVVNGLLWAFIALQILALWPAFHEISRLRAVRAGEEVVEEITPAVIGAIAIGLAFMVVYVLLIVFWMMWVHRTYRNLRPLGADGLSYSPGWAVGYWFIPILNLFRPYQVMRETWRASDPRHGGGTQWMGVAAPSALGAWWAAHLLSNLANNVSLRVGMRSESADVLYGVAWLDVFLIVFDIAVALVEIWLVKTLTDMQDARASAAAAYGSPVGYAATPVVGPGAVPGEQGQ
jgi:hypothetical protein